MALLIYAFVVMFLLTVVYSAIGVIVYKLRGSKKTIMQILDEL